MTTPDDIALRTDFTGTTQQKDVHFKHHNDLAKVVLHHRQRIADLTGTAGALTVVTALPDPATMALGAMVFLETNRQIHVRLDDAELGPYWGAQPGAISQPRRLAPPVLDGLYSRYDVTSLGALTDMALVTSWEDSSGNGRHATTVANESRPVFRRAVTATAGWDAVTFDGTKRPLYIPKLPAGPVTAFVVGKFTGLILANPDTDPPYLYHTGTAIALKAENGTIYNHTAPSNYGIATARLSTTTVLSGWNGAETSGNQTNPSFRPGAMGTWFASGYYANGAITEVLLYQRQLSNEEFAAVIAHLKAKWSVA